MMPRKLSVFLDTSVIIAAVLSPTGGARKVFYLGEAGILELIAGSNVLRETEEVVRRKAPSSLPLLAQLLSAGKVDKGTNPTQKQMGIAKAGVQYLPDAHVLAEAVAAQPDWFIPHDKEHFLNQRSDIQLEFEIGTPGELIQAFIDGFRTT
jgi:predicted nucleic acid-binding protein